MAHDWDQYSDDSPERSVGSWTEAIFATLLLVALLASAVITLSWSETFRRAPRHRSSCWEK
jgi:hypothetical protein